MTEQELGPVGWSNATLEIVSHAPLADHLEHALDDRDVDALEASGVHVDGRHAYVVFDNTEFVARVTLPLSRGSVRDTIIDVSSDDDRVEGYEDITWDAANERWLLLVEAVKRSDDARTPLVVEANADWDVMGSRHVGFEVPSRNKGFEGLACVERDGDHLLLGLCEGNWCESGDAGREPGGGRIKVCRDATDEWEPFDTIALPRGVAFTDYSAVSISDGRIAVVSQESSAAWVAGFSVDDLAITEPGTVYRFPLDGERISYCTVEGVAWWGQDLVTVSDEAKDDHGRSCRTTEQSIHVFAVPSP